MLRFRLWLRYEAIFPPYGLSCMSIAIKLHLNPVALNPGVLVASLPGFVDCLSYCTLSRYHRFNGSRRRTRVNVAFSSDTCPSEKMVEFMAHADLLFHDCQGSHKFNQFFSGNHSPSSLQAGQIAQAAKAKRLVLNYGDSRYFTGETELINEAKEAFSGQVFTAHSGQVYTA